jgi:dihydropteroate synthase-like protein
VTTKERILFVTGRLAELPLRDVLAGVSGGTGWSWDVAVLGVSVAALLHTDLVARRLDPPEGFDRVVLPGWCQGDLETLGRALGMPVDRGPKDLYDLPEYLGVAGRRQESLERYSIEILAEINHASRLGDDELVSEAHRLVDSGADVIDLGMVPGEAWPGVETATRRLVESGFRVSIDSFDRSEVESALAGGAELVLSCDPSNVDWLSPLAATAGASVVAIPTMSAGLESLGPVLDRLADDGVDFRIDPILEPIGLGFASSLERFFEARRRWPRAEMMMGTGNVTELTEVDSAGVNMILAAICQELRVGSVLTTEVINWCRSSVMELDLARRLLHHSLERGVLPKHVDSGLVMLRDSSVRGEEAGTLEQLAAGLTDPNFRIFVEHSGRRGGVLHVMNRDGHWQHTDPYELFDTVLAETGLDLSSQHAFYLGYELAKARTALTLGKRYVQDEALNWGRLTEPEISAVHRRRLGEGQ